MSTQETCVIVGASLAGAKAAEGARAAGYDGRLVLIGAEPVRPYERPPLSKEYLRGEAGSDEKIWVHDEGFYADQEIELLTDTVVSAVDGDSQVVLQDGRTIAFDRLALTTGSELRRLSLPGAELDGIHYLRSVADADELRARLDAGGRVVVVGAGWIGAEVAASARQRGLEVTVIDPVEVPLGRVLSEPIGRFYLDVHRQHGVEMRMQTGVSAFEGNGAVQRVITDDGRSIETDFVVVGVGIVPRTELAEGAGLVLDNGVAVDAGLRSSNPSIFAAGDVASALHPHYGRRVRVEHWSAALNQGTAVGRALAGEQVSYERIPYFFSDQYDVGMEYSGLSELDDEIVMRGRPEDGAFIAFWLRDERLVAGMNVNIWDVNEAIQTLIRAGQPVDRARLRDPDTSLSELAQDVAPSG